MADGDIKLIIPRLRPDWTKLYDIERHIDLVVKPSHFHA